MDAFWIILTGVLAACACALVGTFLMLRRMTLVGDAISHAVLPGIVLAFLFSGSRDPLPMLLGAGALGVLAAVMIELLHRRGGMQSDAAIGVTFTWLFALGVILVTWFAGQVDLDLDCVLYGEILYVPLDQWITASGASLGPRAVWMLGGVAVVAVLFVVVGFKELTVTTFDPVFAATIGISATLWHYALMGVVSVVTVGAFESVGAILVVAMLTAPPATALLLTRSLRSALLLACLFGGAASVGGYYLAALIDGSIAGAIAVVAGGQFAVVLLLRGRRGLLQRGRAGTASEMPSDSLPARTS